MTARAPATETVVRDLAEHVDLFLGVRDALEDPCGFEREVRTLTHSRHVLYDHVDRYVDDLMRVMEALMPDDAARERIILDARAQRRADR
jgi:phosphoribulokinase